MALYGELAENGPHKLMYLNTKSVVGETVWEGLGRINLVGGVVQL